MEASDDACEIATSAVVDPTEDLGVEIRPLGAGDLPALAEHLINPHDWTHGDELDAQTRDELSVLVAWNGPTPVGRVRIRWAGPRSTEIARHLSMPEILGLEVIPSFESRGIGSALLQSAEALALERGHRTVGLGVGLENTRARGLYRRHGYTDSELGTYSEETRLGPSIVRPARIRETCHFWLKQLPEPRLVLFDIDGTLLTSQGAGREAMESAGRSLFGPEFSFGAVEVNGRLDPLIWHDLARANGLGPSPELEQTFRARYREHLELRLQTPRVVRCLPGVLALITRLRRQVGVTLGILSGNYPETGRLKLRAGGLDPDLFQICAWGDDGPSRPSLVEIARARYAKHSPHPLASDRIIVIGDTPHDVSCALTNGCRALAVATGHSSLEELVAAGAHRVEASLATVESLTAWIVGASNDPS